MRRTSAGNWLVPSSAGRRKATTTLMMMTSRSGCSRVFLVDTSCSVRPTTLYRWTRSRALWVCVPCTVLLVPHSTLLSPLLCISFPIIWRLLYIILRFVLINVPFKVSLAKTECHKTRVISVSSEAIRMNQLIKKAHTKRGSSPCTAHTPNIAHRSVFTHIWQLMTKPFSLVVRTVAGEREDFKKLFLVNA